MSPIERTIYELLGEYGGVLPSLPLLMSFVWLFWRSVEFSKLVRVKEKEENIRLPPLLSHGWRGTPCPDMSKCRELKRLYYMYHFEAVMIFIVGEATVVGLVIIFGKYFGKY